MPPLCPIPRGSSGRGPAARRWLLGFRRALWLIAACAAGPARADIYDPPAGYYASATGTGATLKNNLHNIIDNHTIISYSGATSALAVTDLDPHNSANLLTVYDRTSIKKQYSTSPLIWNREHTWPRSRGVGDSGPDDSDLFNLRPALVANNGDRGNLNFGGAYGLPWGVVNDGGSKWATGTADAGMIARQQFYMAVRYDGSDASTTDLELFAGNPATSQGSGDLTRLVQWHFAAVPDTFERNRNKVIFEQFQKNRDPFIDHPEWVWSVFVDQANDTALTLAGGTAGAAGATSLNLDLGRRLVGAPLPAAQAVTLNKAGVDGTYFSVTAAGSASSSVNGKFNAFTVGSTGSRSINVGLAAGASMATAGLRTGTVTIDNLDITTGGGAASGANDGNDVVNVSLSVLDHANGSFAAASDLNTLTLDFGSVAQGSTLAPLNFSLFNVAAPSGLTAGLDLDAILGSGDTSAFSTTLTPFSGASTLAPGGSQAFTASFDTSAVGAFNASYTLNLSDENLPGATALSGLTLSLTGTVSGPISPTADFDGDGVVDGADFLAWQRGLGLSGTATRLDGDANGDQTVNALDLEVWRTQVAVASPAMQVVPEPTAAALAIAAIAACAIRRRVK